MNIDTNFHTQAGNGIYDDCGETCLQIVTERVYGKLHTIKEWEDSTGRHGQTDTLLQLRAGAEKMGYGYRYKTWPLSILLAEVEAGYPAIALINYKDLPDRLKAWDYRGGHFVVITGVEGEYLFYTDPLHPTAPAGHNIRITKADFDVAYGAEALVPDEPVFIQPPEDREMTESEVKAMIGEMRSSIINEILNKHFVPRATAVNQYHRDVSRSLGWGVKNVDGEYRVFDAKGKLVEKIDNPDELALYGFRFEDAK